ncbi:thioredoxin-dependent thiol peroxidase [Rothia sp. AR01]|uniref:thioredoxin-dependent peroxiredoxin n=1 Tax=Rothia santali TaxID=2949643 RepID=A0A9X2HEQ7_9MICC|nr:thioredoxin-dependent thiol peroxidase [Rothia santali]MCP3425884.1 thioredoxin-dependent thiol peroxidase [Rothia santali]
MTDQLTPGDVAPDFSLPNAEGGTTSLADLAGGRTVLYFYPAAFTPGCTTEACDFRDNLASLTAAGYTVLGISGDSVERLAEFAQEYRLTYGLLSDEGSAVAQRFGAWGEKTVGGETRTGVLRSTFVIDEDGRIAQAGYYVSADGHVAQLRRDLGVDA